jgi:hypothetical protein
MLTEGLIYHLNADVVGPYSGNKYGMKGDEVFLVADMIQMCIVEKNKIRFPVKTSMLGEVQTNKVEEAKPIINPQPMQTNQSKFRKKVSKPSIHNSKLF